MNTKKYNGEKVTYVNFGDWSAIWIGNEQVHFHDTPYMERLLDVLGIENERLNIDFDGEEYNRIDGKTLPETMEWIRKRAIKAERAELQRLDDERTKVHARLAALSNSDEEDIDDEDDD